MHTFKLTQVYEGGKVNYNNGLSQASSRYKEAVAALRQYEVDNNIQHTESWLDLNRLEETWTFSSEDAKEQWKTQYKTLICDNFADDGAAIGFTKAVDNELGLHLPE